MGVGVSRMVGTPERTPADVKTPSQPIEATIYRDCQTLICPLYLAVPSRCLAWKHLSITRSLAQAPPLIYANRPWFLPHPARSLLSTPGTGRWVKVKGFLPEGPLWGSSRRRVLPVAMFTYLMQSLSCAVLRFHIKTFRIVLLTQSCYYFYCPRPGISLLLLSAERESYLIGYFISALQTQLKGDARSCSLHVIWYS